MFTIMISPDDYKYLYYACKYYHAKLLPPQDNGSDYLFCSIRCIAEQLFYIGKLFERMKVEAEHFNDEKEE